MTVIEYVTEEVQRQGHDTDGLDGIERVGWMLNAWSYALAKADCEPTMMDAVYLGTLVEPHKNATGIRKCGVRVGTRICPKPDEITKMIDELFSYSRQFPPALEFYKSFEEIHPFVDGNGRTGKILLNWLNKTLLNPIFPPNDLWGHPIRNP